MPLYDYRLEAIVAAADQGSFSKAAAKLGISTPALAKQVDTFEGENGVKLFDRGHSGVALTPAGRSLAADARAAITQSGDALRRAKSLSSGSIPAVRLGVSLLCPAGKVQSAWPRIKESDPELRLELVPVGDIYENPDEVIGSLGKNVDILQVAYSPQRMEGRCSALPLGSVPLSIDMSRESPMATLAQIRPEDLKGQRVFVLRHACVAMDDYREELLSAGAEVVDVTTYDFPLFNECAESGGAIVSAGAWAGAHPSLTSVPLERERLAECAMLYPLDPAEPVRRFVEALRAGCAPSSRLRPMPPSVTSKRPVTEI